MEINFWWGKGKEGADSVCGSALDGLSWRCLLLHLELEGEKTVLKSLHLGTSKCRKKACTCALCFEEEWVNWARGLSFSEGCAAGVSPWTEAQRMFGEQDPADCGEPGLSWLCNNHQPFCATWGGETGHRLLCSRCLNPWLHWQPQNWGLLCSGKSRTSWADPAMEGTDGCLGSCFNVNEWKILSSL